MRFILILTAITLSSLALEAQCNKVNVSYKDVDGTLVVSFTNNSSDTLHLFSTYFASPYIFSNVLHRVNTKEKIYKVSFLPLLPYLAGYLTDKLILTDVNKIVMVGQNLYSFIEVLPKNTVEVKLPLNQLFSDANKKRNAVKDFNNETIKRKDLKEITLSKQKGEFEQLLEFAFYEKVDLLLARDVYIKSGIKAYEQAKNYKIIKVPFSLEKSIIPLNTK